MEAAIYHPVVIAFVFAFGACVGSFLNVCIYRLPEGLSIVTPPSSCPKCKQLIKPYDNIPVFSYLILRGKCRNCKAPFSPRYAIVEFITGIFAILVLLKFGISYATLIYFFFIATLITITFIDIDHYLIFDIITYPMIAIGLVLSYFHAELGLLPGVSLKSSMIGAASGAGFFLLIAGGYYLIRKKEGMGLGDVKLLAMLGAFLGIKSVFFIVFGSSVIGAIYGIPYTMLVKKDSQHLIPFGPFLAGAAVIYLFYGEQIIDAYIRLVTS